MFLISEDFYFFKSGSSFYDSYLSIYALLIDINSFFIYLSSNSFSICNLTSAYIKSSSSSIPSSLTKELLALTF